MAGPGRAARDRGKRLLERVFAAGQRVGVDVLPRHFYSAVPDLRQLSTTTDWRAPSAMPGVAGTDLDAQLSTLRDWLTPAVVDALRDDVHAAAVARNGADGYGPMEAQVLHAFVATQRPRRVVQVGAGVSTAVVLDAAATHGVEVEVVAVDPFPTDLLVELDAAGDITLVREPAQTVALDVLTSLEAGDLLFIDSTHTVKPGSEVNRLILDVLPRLAPGVVVHVHDVYFPYDHPPDLLDGRLFFWTESTLLHAFLAGHATASLTVSTSMLAHGRSPALQDLLVGYRPVPMTDGLYDVPLIGHHFPSATYLTI